MCTDAGLLRGRWGVWGQMCYGPTLGRGGREVEGAVNEGLGGGQGGPISGSKKGCRQEEKGVGDKIGPKKDVGPKGTSYKNTGPKLKEKPWQSGEKGKTCPYVFPYAPSN